MIFFIWTEGYTFKEQPDSTVAGVDSICTPVKKWVGINRTGTT